jgi:hypothetical protein
MCEKLNTAEKHKKYIDFYLDKDSESSCLTLTVCHCKLGLIGTGMNMCYCCQQCLTGTGAHPCCERGLTGVSPCCERGLTGVSPCCEEYWGIGIENESYMMTEKMEDVGRDFLLNNTKRERYSIDYFLNYKMDEYKKTVSSIKNVTVPYYINSYMFQNMDIYGENRTLYTKGIKMNTKFCGMTIHEYMKYMSKKYTKLFDKNVIFDGDTIEFTTNKFYKTTVNNVMNELNTIKHVFLREVNKYLANKFVFSGYGSEISYPSHNYGFVKYMTNKNNIGICNSGTYHINITLPTTLSLNGMKIKNPSAFKNTHQNAIHFIQWVEPLIVALYGTPDILSCAAKDGSYCQGSLRLMMSRYIGLGTYDTDTMEPGKKLNDFDYKSDASHYFNKLHDADSPYNPPETIGYDFNYNKFKNHGIELRILDYFPEEYLTDVINFIILVCQHSVYNNITCERKPQNSKLWNEFVVSCIKNGSEAKVSNELYLCLREIFGMDKDNYCCFSLFRSNKERTIMNVITKISHFLYDKYHKDTIVQKMSPLMKKIVWVDYNKIIREKYANSIHFRVK